MPTGIPDYFGDHFGRYLRLLTPLFDRRHCRDQLVLFEFACALIRPTGIQPEGWDPLLESTELVDDLLTLSKVELSTGEVVHPERTRARLALISHRRLTEVDYFYELLPNLLRVRTGQKSVLSPFDDLAKPVKTKRGIFGEKRIPPSPSKKIARIKELGAKAGMPEIAAALEEIYYTDIRNAVFHADYTLTDSEFRMMKGHYS